MKTHNSIFFLLVLFSGILFAQNDPCSKPESKQFDFWVGKWKAEWTDAKGEAVEGKNIIKKILDGCVIEENFSSPNDNFFGKSMSVYNPRINKWEQTWVDNNGGFMVFSGEYKNDKMILQREVKNKEGKLILQRMIFYNIEKNSFDWNWERSDDEGKSWELAWKIHYSRME